MKNELTQPALQWDSKPQWNSGEAEGAHRQPRDPSLARAGVQRDPAAVPRDRLSEVHGQ
eukprot:CAMPEP_0113675110 /NCGR_PEP_ID=MMETSP0038_2-20120614/7817_1 /TAXON_ID=2898 /ORGANISM="Cryptomonas paramecium" /LENGTH=58 /DNA_ID=CAMNT_0000591815 /DNA_START=36 /DNA_END=208 /DNA_ORIENTATION=+ /assembly_acc=CAM_ASM_000170